MSATSRRRRRPNRDRRSLTEPDGVEDGRMEGSLPFGVLRISSHAKLDD
jgi:hypothetical protein